VNRLPKYRGLLVGALLVAVCAGCAQTEPAKNTLGNLPAEPLDDTPQVSAMTFFAHGHLLERSGNYERAVVQYRKALRLKSDFVGAHNRLGITLNKLGRHDEASEHFRQAIALRPDEAYLYNNLGFSLYLEKKYDQADEVLKHALELSPDFARARMNHAIVLAELGRYDAAYQELLKVGSRADACYNMGLMLTEGKRYQQAAQYLEAALAVRPDFDAARRQLREVGRLAAEAEALQAVRVAKTDHPTPAPTVAGGPAGGPQTAQAARPSRGGTTTRHTSATTTSTQGKSTPTNADNRTVKAGGQSETPRRASARSGKQTASATLSEASRGKSTGHPQEGHQPAEQKTVSAQPTIDADLAAIEQVFERDQNFSVTQPGDAYDGDVLAALILQALDAIEHHACDAEELWCEMTEYVATAMSAEDGNTLAK